MSRRAIKWVAWAFLVPATAAAQNAPLRFAEDKRPTTLNPAFGTTMVDARAEELLFNGLYSVDRNLNPVARLAAELQKSADGTEATVFLRDAFWHDGQRVGPADVIFTVEAYKGVNVPPSVTAQVVKIKKVEASGPRAVKFTFSEALPQPETFLQFKILPKHAFKAGMTANDNFRIKPVGAGPYKLIRIQERFIDFEADSTQSLGIKSLRAKIVPDVKMQIEQLSFDDLDVIIQVPPRYRLDIEGLGERYELMPYETLSWWYLGINHQDPHLSNVKVRRALMHALDRDSLRKTRLGDGETISGPFSPRSPYYNDQVEPYRFDLKSSAKLMAEAGYGKQSGFYAKGGKKVQWKLLVSREKGDFKEVVLDLQSRLREAGFEVELEWLDEAALAERLRKKQDFALTLGVWHFDGAVDLGPLFESNGPLNFFNYKNVALDELIRRGRETKDPALFEEIQRRIHATAHDDLPYAFLWSLAGYSAVSGKLVGVDIHPFRYFTWIDGWRWQ